MKGQNMHSDHGQSERQMGPNPDLVIRGVRLWRGYLDAAAQVDLVSELRKVVAAAPLFSPITPSGKPMSVRMTSAGDFGWVSDRQGYRYAPTHPRGTPWPAIPAQIRDIWDTLAGSDRAPECCLINYYDRAARMGMHQDRDEADFSQPVLSVSLGDDALFRIGNETRGGNTESLWLSSGDVLVLGGDARLLYHGVDRLRPGSSQLLRDGGRINLTLRVVR